MKTIVGCLQHVLTEFIQDSTYQFVGSNTDVSTTITDYTSHKIRFESEKYQRGIRASLTDYYKYKRMFINVENQNGSHSSLPLYKYLEDYCNVTNASDLMLLDQYEGNSLEEKLSIFFATMKSKLDNRFFDILKGKDWVEIPTDWHGYK